MKLDICTRHINYKLSVSHNTWYINLRHKLDEVLKNEKRKRTNDILLDE